MIILYLFMIKTGLFDTFSNIIKNIHDSFKKYFSVAAEVLEIAMKYNRQHKEEHEKIRTKLRANKEATDYLKQLEANLF